MPLMADYTCRSSVAFEKRNEDTLALACAILAYVGCELKGDLDASSTPGSLPRPRVVLVANGLGVAGACGGHTGHSAQHRGHRRCRWGPVLYAVRGWATAVDM
jgi:hypothetical protein